MKVSTKIIKDNLNNRIYVKDDQCFNCGKIGEQRRNFEENTIFCRDCGFRTALPPQHLSKKQMEEYKK